MSFSCRRFFAILNTEHCFFPGGAPTSPEGRRKSYVNQALVLYVLKTRSKRTRVGLTATKKIGHAVQRNRARRVMKAAIDEHLDYNIGGYDLVFVARGMTPRLKSWQLSAIVAKLFAQAGLPDKAKQPGAKPPATLPPVRKPEA